MSFRRRNEKGWKDSAWFRRHEEELVAAGIPASLAAREVEFWAFVEEPYPMMRETGWSLEMLDEQQARRLLALFEDLLGDDFGGLHLPEDLRELLDAR